MITYYLYRLKRHNTCRYFKVRLGRKMVKNGCVLWYINIWEHSTSLLPITSYNQHFTFPQSSILLLSIQWSCSGSKKAVTWNARGTSKMVSESQLSSLIDALKSNVIPYSQLAIYVYLKNNTKLVDNLHLLYNILKWSRDCLLYTKKVTSRVLF